MPSHVALTYTADVDWSAPEQAGEMAEYVEFGKAAAAVIRGGNALYPTASATTVRVRAARTATSSPATAPTPRPRRS